MDSSTLNAIVALDYSMITIGLFCTGITNVLTMAFLGIDNRRDLPKVSYSTALDYFVCTCNGFILATIIQFAGVHFFTKHGSGEIPLDDSDLESEDHEDDAEVIGRNHSCNNHYEKNDILKVSEDIPWTLRIKISSYQYLVFPLQNHRVYVLNNQQQGNNLSFKARANGNSPSLNAHRSSHSYSCPSKESCCTKFYHCLIGNHKYRDLKIKTSVMYRKGRINSVSRIDMASRILFPLAFIVFNVVYWTLYLDHEGSDVLI